MTQTVKFVDLFAGTGGIRLAFERAMAKRGLLAECVKSAEIDQKACETYRMNFSEDAFCDVKNIANLPRFDVLLAGFPCQAFSSAGKMMGFDDTRGTLFFEVAKIIKSHRPQVCFLENVRGLISHDKGKTLSVILATLHELGYSVEYRLLNSSNFGIPQNRVRIYIVASLNTEINLSILSDRGAADSHAFKRRERGLFDNLEKPFVSDVLDDVVDEKYLCSPWFVKALKSFTGGDLRKLHGVRLIDTRNGNSIHSWEIGVKGECDFDEITFMNELISNRRRKEFGTHQDGKALTKEQIATFSTIRNIDSIISSLMRKGYLKDIDGKYNPVCGNMSFEVFKFLDPQGISITLTASDSHKLGVFHNGFLRRITPRECARLQGYPEDYILHPNDNYAYKQLGNAVSVPVFEKFILDYFDNNQFEVSQFS